MGNPTVAVGVDVEVRAGEVALVSPSQQPAWWGRETTLEASGMAFPMVDEMRLNCASDADTVADASDPETGLAAQGPG
jgi:hypothetical protein